VSKLIKEMVKYLPSCINSSKPNLKEKTTTKSSFNVLKKKPKSVNYRIVRKIGNGAFGDVYLGRSEITNEMVAIKRTYQNPKFANREPAMCRLLQHQNVVKFYSISFDEQDGKQFLVLVMEYYPKSLQNVIDQIPQNRKQFSFDQIQFLAHELFQGLKYIHNHDVAHRDIKPDNILINLAENRIVIADLGSAKFIYDGSYNKSYICSRLYRAPELICGCERYTELIDVWSVALVILECILLRPLFNCRGGTQNDLFLEMEFLFGKLTRSEKTKLGNGVLNGLPVQRKKKFEIPRLRTEFANNVAFMDLMSKCLQFDPQIRCKAQDALAHPYFARYHTNG